MSRFTDALDAWHGSHADFDEFRDDKINTGEGAQVYGHGHYVGEAKGTGEEYLNSVSRQHGVLRGMYFTGPHATSPVVKIEDLVGAYDRAIMGGPSGTLRSRLRDIGASHLNDDELQIMMNALATAVDIPDINPQEHIDYGLDHHQEILDSDPDGDDEETNEARTYIAAHPKITKIFENLKQGTGGRLYQLKVDLSEPHILDWEKSLADHHPEALKRLKDHLGQIQSGTDVSGYNAYAKGFTGRSDALGVKLDESMSGQKLYGYLKTMHGGAPAASKALLDSGIHGIRYLDQRSRGYRDPVLELDGNVLDRRATHWPQRGEAARDQDARDRRYAVILASAAHSGVHGGSVSDGYEGLTNAAEYMRKSAQDWLKSRNVNSWDDPDIQHHPNYAHNQEAFDIANWFDKNHHRLRFETPKPTYNYVVFDPKLIKMVRKYDDRGNVVHDYTQASGTELRPVDHDPFAEEKK